MSKPYLIYLSPAFLCNHASEGYERIQAVPESSLNEGDAFGGTIQTVIWNHGSFLLEPSLFASTLCILLS